MRSPQHTVDPAPSIPLLPSRKRPLRLRCRQNYTPQSSGSARPGARLSLILRAEQAPSPGWEARGHQLPHNSQPSISRHAVSTLPRNEKQMSLVKKKVIYVVESFGASRNLKRFATWGTKRLFLESSCTEGTDVFCGNERQGNVLV